MQINAYRTLRISLAAATALLLFAQNSLPAYHHFGRRLRKAHHSTGRHNNFTSKKHSLQFIKAADHARTLTTSLTDGHPRRVSTTFGRSKHGNIDVYSGNHVIASLGKHDRFMVLERDGDNFDIRLNDGRTGVVSANAVSLEETRKPLPVSDISSVNGDLIRTAYAYRGTRYRSGGISSRGFDCSGFVKFVYATQGIRLPHSSSAQFSCGTPVSRSDLRAGDIVFFKGTYRRGISHVGIYVGNGKFIHSSTYGRGVCVDNLGDPYYRRRYVGARRP